MPWSRAAGIDWRCDAEPGLGVRAAVRRRSPAGCPDVAARYRRRTLHFDPGARFDRDTPRRATGYRARAHGRGGSAAHRSLEARDPGRPHHQHAAPPRRGRRQRIDALRIDRAGCRAGRPRAAPPGARGGRRRASVSHSGTAQCRIHRRPARVSAQRRRASGPAAREGIVRDRRWPVLAIALAAAGCTDPLVPSRAAIYPFADAFGDVFHWPADRLPVRIYADPRGDLSALVSRAVDLWARQLLYGELTVVMVADSNRADVIVRWADSVPPAAT